MFTQENITSGLAGRVAGVTLNQTGGVGSSVSVVIRGRTSLTTDNQPLYVVDGIPISSGLNNVSGMGDRNEVDYGNPISDLNPSDIADMTVLKGDRKSTRLNSSHVAISYAVFCLKKKNKIITYECN